MEVLEIIDKKKMFAPKFRFKEFKEAWHNVNLGDIANFSKGKGLSKNDISHDGKLECIRYGELYTHYKETIISIKSKTNINPDELVLSEGNDVIIPASGETPIDIATASCVLKSGVALGGDLNIIKTKNNGVFLSYYLNSKKKIDIASLAQGNSVVHLYSKQLTLLNLHIPSLPEQQKIASFLSAVDEKIQQLTHKKELLEQYKKGVMQQLFSGKLRFHDEKRNNYPKWEEKRLGDVGEIVSGLTYSPVDVDNEGVLVLRSSNVQDRRLAFEDNVYVKVNVGDFNPVKENDILICVRNGSKNLIGKNALIDKKNEGVAFGTFMAVYRSDSNLFLFHYFDTDNYKDEVHKNLGATINSINGSDLRKFKIPFPCKEEQKKIANYLSAIDKKIESVNNQITQTQIFKKGLLQQMFV